MKIVTNAYFAGILYCGVSYITGSMLLGILSWPLAILICLIAAGGGNDTHENYMKSLDPESEEYQKRYMPR